MRDKWAERPYQKLSTAGRAVTAGLPGLDKRKSWLISNSGKAARRYRATGGVGGGGSRSDKKDGRVSSGGEGPQWMETRPLLSTLGRIVGAVCSG